MSRRLAAILVGCAVLAGCGGGGASAATSPPATSPEAQPGGAGDEQPARVPVRITFSPGGPHPRFVGVPAFLALELTGVSHDGDAHTLRLRGVTVHVPPGGQASRHVKGLRKGRYPVAVDGVPGQVTVISGA